MSSRFLAACALLLAIASARETWADGLRERAVLPELMHALHARYPLVTDWQVAPLGTNDAPAGLDSGAPVRIDVLKVGARSAVRVRTSAAGGPLQQRTLWFSVAGLHPVLTVTRSLAAGTILDATQVALAERDIVAANCKPLAEATGIENLRTRVALRAGAVVCSRSVEPRPPVSRGEAVTVRYLGRIVALTAGGVAQSDGEVGRVIAIRNPSSREVFRAVVSGPKEVTIHE